MLFHLYAGFSFGQESKSTNYATVWTNRSQVRFNAGICSIKSLLRSAPPSLALPWPPLEALIFPAMLLTFARNENWRWVRLKQWRLAPLRHPVSYRRYFNRPPSADSLGWTNASVGTGRGFREIVGVMNFEKWGIPDLLSHSPSHSISVPCFLFVWWDKC